MILQLILNNGWILFIQYLYNVFIIFLKPYFFGAYLQLIMSTIS